MTKGQRVRTFSLEEAQHLLPMVRERTRQALEEIHSLSVPDDGEEGDESFQESATRILATWAIEIEAMGLEVKGPWLVDFDSGGGYYCWCWPEESLDFFHGYSEGFASRVRLQ